MASAHTPEPMTAATASRLVEFARACKAAARVVSMYPATHPNIQAALARMVAAGTAATTGGPLQLVVLPDNLLVDGRGLPKPDATVSELAALLHAHRIGELALLGPLSPGGWHSFLSLVATSPEAVRVKGGIAKVWQAAGGGPIEIREIDYAEVLKERSIASEAEADWDEIIASCLVGDSRSQLDERTLASLLDIARDADRLGEFLNRLRERALAGGHSAEIQRESIVRLLHGLANYVAQHAPDAFDDVMDNIATGATRLSADQMLSLLAQPSPAGDAGGPADKEVDLGGELRARFTEDRLGAFVAENIVRDHGATGRLAEAFNALATTDAERRTALALAEERVSLSPLGAEPDFNDVWAHVMSVMMSYSDADYVPEAYDRELTMAQATVVDIEHINDDPPDRIAAWLSTVADDDMRALDQQMLGDLLRLEDRPDAWRSVLELSMARIEQLVLVGDLRLAGELLKAAASVGDDPASSFSAEARSAIAQLTTGPVVKHLMLVMRQAGEDEMPALTAFCRSMGPGLIAPLTTAVGAEESRLAVRRVKDVLVSFGAAARQPARALRESPNPAVRRVAIEVLRAVGGDDALTDLQSLLGDADPNVQREALRAIVQIGSNEAYAVLEQSLKDGEPRTRDAVVHALGSLGDERAAPLLVHMLQHTSHRGPTEAIYLSAVEALGRSGASPRGLDALAVVLQRGEWWAPRRTARLRSAAARALHATASREGDALLETARTNGSRGVRRAAAEAMAQPRTSRPAGEHR
ncbi:MAG: HEAT repeat domain-containing protein [Acidobacteriota bacterium]|nr:HEAT repeat domain-containing protein [Acidobacteriota bacterium]